MAEDRIQIRISEDRLEAWVLIEAGEPAERTQLDRLLARAGVSEGLEEALLDRAAHALELERAHPAELCVAKGCAPLPGRDGYLELTDPAGPTAGRLREDDSLDYRERSLIVPVSRDDVLGRVHPPLPGKPGVDVLGDEIAAIDGEACDLRHGEGVRQDEEGQLRATRAGARSMAPDGTIDIVELYEHAGSVDLSSGHLETQGSLSIGRDVARGMNVCASHDVLVRGTLDGGRIRAGGSIEIAGGAIGQGEGRLDANGDVSVRHLLDMRVRCEGLLHVKRSVSGSRIRAESIMVDGPMLGDEARAETSIVVRDVGSAAGGPCRLRAACPLDEMPQAQRPSRSGRRRSGRAMRKSDRGRVRSASGSRGQTTSRKSGRESSLDRRTDAEDRLAWRRRANALQKTATIEVTGKAFAGCRIDFGSGALLLEETVTAQRFRFDGERDEIIMENLS